MLSILGAIIGLFGSMIPEALKLWKTKIDNAHELSILKVQAEMAIKEHEYRLEEISAQADIASEQAAYKAAEIKYTGIKWIDGIVELWNGIIRPWIATVMVCFYGLVKVAQYHVIMSSGSTNMWKTIWLLWTSEDMAIFATIISFFFGGRIMKYAMNKGGAFTSRQLINGNGNGNGGHSQPTLVPVVVKPKEKPKNEIKPPPVDPSGI